MLDLITIFLATLSFISGIAIGKTVSDRKKEIDYLKELKRTLEGVSYTPNKVDRKYRQNASGIIGVLHLNKGVEEPYPEALETARQLKTHGVPLEEALEYIDKKLKRLERKEGYYHSAEVLGDFWRGIETEKTKVPNKHSQLSEAYIDHTSEQTSQSQQYTPPVQRSQGGSTKPLKNTRYKTPSSNQPGEVSSQQPQANQQSRIVGRGGVPLGDIYPQSQSDQGPYAMEGEGQEEPPIQIQPSNENVEAPTGDKKLLWPGKQYQWLSTEKSASWYPKDLLLQLYNVSHALGTLLDTLETIEGTSPPPGIGDRIKNWFKRRPSYAFTEVRAAYYEIRDAIQALTQLYEHQPGERKYEEIFRVVYEHINRAKKLIGRRGIIRGGVLGKLQEERYRTFVVNAPIYDEHGKLVGTRPINVVSYAESVLKSLESLSKGAKELYKVAKGRSEKLEEVIERERLEERPEYWQYLQQLMELEKKREEEKTERRKAMWKALERIFGGGAEESEKTAGLGGE
ncbi:MAG: hypothetical protein J7K98_00750 [Candidatus Aenigmarchaeota archaeon]|nr:hypothetical protein [Candidatus Aenigmarchaeota archaeon]